MSEPRERSFETEAIGWVAVLLAIAGFAMFIWPNYYLRHRVTDRNYCINNLRQIDAAANQFAIERGLTNGAAIHFPDDLTPYIKLNSARKIPPCRAGGVYAISKVGEMPTCSLSNTVSPPHILP